MKKTLAMILALLLLSASLAACNNKTPAPTPDDEDDGYINTDKNDQNDNENNNEDPDNQGNTDNENENDNQQQTPNTNGWVTKNDVVYAGTLLRLRTSPSTTSGNIAKTVEAGTKLNRAEANVDWSKVTLDGDTTTYYVSNDWVSLSRGNFVFTDCETPVTLTIKDSEYNIMFFENPFESEDMDAYYDIVLCKSGFKLSNVSSTYSLKKTGTSENGEWIRVEFVGTITISATNSATFTEAAPGVFYVKMRSITRGDIVDPTYSAGSGSTPGHG